MAFGSGEGMTPLLGIPNCARCDLTSFEGSEERVACTEAGGIANAKQRAKALWAKLKPLLKAGKFAAVQVRRLWSEEERRHLRPGHFWACELGDADGKGSPIIAGPFKERTTFEGQRFDEGECAILLRRYYHRVASDPNGLTFVRFEPGPGEKFIINSSELRAVQGVCANHEGDGMLLVIGVAQAGKNVTSSSTPSTCQSSRKGAAQGQLGKAQL